MAQNWVAIHTSLVTLIQGSIGLGWGGLRIWKEVGMLVVNFELNHWRRPMWVWPKLFLSPKRDHVIEHTLYKMRPKSEIYTPKWDNEHPHHFHMRNHPPLPPPGYFWMICENHVVNCGVNNYMKDDHRSYRHNFSSCEKKAWKKCTGFKPLTVMILVISMQIKARNTLQAGGWGYCHIWAI